MEDSKETRTPSEAVIPPSPLTGTDIGLKIRCPPKQDRCAFFLRESCAFARFQDFQLQSGVEIINIWRQDMRIVPQQHVARHKKSGVGNVECLVP